MAGTNVCRNRSPERIGLSTLLCKQIKWLENHCFTRNTTYRHLLPKNRDVACGGPCYPMSSNLILYFWSLKKTKQENTYLSVQGFLAWGPSPDSSDLFLLLSSTTCLTSPLEALVINGSVWITMLAAKQTQNYSIFCKQRFYEVSTIYQSCACTLRCTVCVRECFRTVSL